MPNAAAAEAVLPTVKPTKSPTAPLNSFAFATNEHSVFPPTLDSPCVRHHACTFHF